MNEDWKSHALVDYSALKGKRVIIRLDWNMPVDDKGAVADTSRAEVTFDFLRKLSFGGVKMVLMTHFADKKESIAPIAVYIREHLPFVTFSPSLAFEELEQATHALKEGDALLIENVRLWQGEEDNLPSLARSFASLGDIYINNAFSVSHRAHASVAGIPQFLLSYFGPLFVRELEHLTQALTPKKPALLIVGGSKIRTKLKLIENYLDKGVHVFVGGAMVHDIWKAKGLDIGASLFDGTTSLSERILNHPMLITPTDVILESGETVAYTSIPKDGKVVDCGEKTVAALGVIIDEASTVIVNGPLGLYERGWLKGTEGVLGRVATSKALSYIGGGDTVAVAHSLHLLQKFTFVSLGGGAMLDFLASGTLPGIHAVTEWKQTGYR